MIYFRYLSTQAFFIGVRWSLFPRDECHALLRTVYGVSCKIHSPL